MALKGYEKIKTVGKGAFGTAVLYRKEDSQTLVVIKEINLMELTASERQMALNEVQVLSSLRHPNIIQYLGSFAVDGVLMIEMEFADSGTLAQLIANSSRLSEHQVLSLFIQCVAAIKYMHQNNILHRDLKTANVFLTKDNHIKVGDFGISKIMSTKGQAQTVLGTPYYISPEMCEGKQYDMKSDIWALGCILYEMACQQKTFKGDNLPALVNKIMAGTFDPIPNVYSKGLRDLVTDLLKKDPALRPTAAETYDRTSVLLNEIKPNTRLQRPVRSVLYQISGSGLSFTCIPVPLPPTLRVAQVAVSNTHYIALSDAGLVFTWGEGKRGQLGHPEPPMWLQQPTLVQTLTDNTIVSVRAGDGFSVFLSDSGVVMTCGDGTFGSLGQGDWINYSRPRVVEGLLDKKVRQVDCGDHHCVAITECGDMFAWGQGNCGQLGTGLDQDFCKPTRVLMDSNQNIKSVHCGPDCTMILTASGSAFACGSNRHNKLGLNHSLLQVLGFKHKIVEKYVKLQIVQSLKQWRIIKVSMAVNHSAALTECGYVVTMGSNAEAQTGYNSTSPRVVAAIEDKIATDVESGPTFTVMTTTHNSLYFWGTHYTGNESDGSTTLSQVALQPEEALALYASPSQISRGQHVSISQVSTLWDMILVLVDTTVPLTTQVKESDSIGPLPNWITAELAHALG